MKAAKIALVLAATAAAVVFLLKRNFNNFVPELLLLKRTAPQPVLDSTGQPIPGTGPA